MGILKDTCLQCTSQIEKCKLWCSHDCKRHFLLDNYTETQLLEALKNEEYTYKKNVGINKEGN